MLKVDNDNSSAMYVDKSRLQCYGTDKIVRLACDDGYTMLDLYLALFKGAYDLNGVDVAVLRFMIDFGRGCMLREIMPAVTVSSKKSESTVYRAIDRLKRKGLITVSPIGLLELSDLIAYDMDSILNANVLTIMNGVNYI